MHVRLFSDLAYNCNNQNSWVLVGQMTLLCGTTPWKALSLQPWQFSKLLSTFVDSRVTNLVFRWQWTPLCLQTTIRRGPCSAKIQMVARKCAVGREEQGMLNAVLARENQHGANENEWCIPGPVAFSSTGSLTVYWIYKCHNLLAD